MSAVRIYPDGQLTLPEEVSSALRVKEGDLLEVSTVGDMVILKPARKPTHIFPHGSPEAEEEYRQSQRDYAEGRYQTSENLQSFLERLGLASEEVPANEDASPAVSLLEANLGAIKTLVDEALSASRQGDPNAAVEFLEEARRSLEAGELLSAPQSRSSSS